MVTPIQEGIFGKQEVERVSLATHAKSLFKNLDKEILAQLDYISQTKLVRKRGVECDVRCKLHLLSAEQKVLLHKILQSYSDKFPEELGSALGLHLFDLEDSIFREVSEKDYLSLLKEGNPLYQKIDDFKKNHSRFHSLSFKSQKVNPLGNAQIHDHVAGSSNRARPVKVIKACLESPKNPFAGVGAVLTGLQAAHRKMSEEKVYTIHPLYSKDKADIRACAFQGVITHQYNGKLVYTSVYKNKEGKEYLLQPDPDYKEVFNIPLKEGIYSTTAKTSLSNRTLYFGSAVAAFTAFYRGKSQCKEIDILHCDTQTVAGVAFPLLSRTFGQIRADAQLDHAAKKVFVQHGPLTERQWENLTGVGLPNTTWKEQLFPWKELVFTGTEYADKVVTVSSQVAAQLLSEDPAVSKGRHALLKGQDRVVVIRNGVDAEKFDVTNRALFGALALERTFDAQGRETTDYVAHRKYLKSLLFQARCIADLDLPLAVFVGRYQFINKGTNILYQMVKSSEHLKMQTVTLGIKCGDTTFLQGLQLLQKGKLNNKLRVYSSYEEQKKPFTLNGKTYPFSVSQLIQAATDFRLMTSHHEPCGLTAMEGQCSGAILVSSYIEGLKDICVPVGSRNQANEVVDLSNEANAFCYQNSQDVQEAQEALKTAITTWEKKSVEEKNQIARRLRNNAVQNYSWYYKDPVTNKVTGAAVCYKNLYNKLAGRPQVEGAYVEPAQASWMPIPKKSFLEKIGRILTESFAWVSMAMQWIALQIELLFASTFFWCNSTRHTSERILAYEY